MLRHGFVGMLAAVALLVPATAQPPPGPPPVPSPTPVNQSPVPTTTAVSDPSIFTLSGDFVITNVPTTRTYCWNISAVAGAMDGYAREMFAVNSQYPGPLIEANDGDTIVVYVTNYLSDGQAIHWHGITQNSSQWMDGVPGISQCIIPPNGTFTYNFTVTGQYGTYWWHSHYANTLADGVIGALIVHSPEDPLQRGRDFDEERILYVSDWVDVTSDTVVTALRSGKGFDGSPAPPQGDAVLINGIGQTNCTNSLIRHNSTCLPPTPAEIQVPVNKRIRFRIVNTSGYMTYRISIDNHAFALVEADDTPIYGPTDLHEVQISAGQRYSIIVNTTHGQAGDAFWLRAQAGLGCTGFQVQSGLAVFRYVAYNGTASTQQPTSQAWNDLAGVTHICQDMDEQYSLVPRVAENAPTDILQIHQLDSSLGSFVSVNGVRHQGFAFNNISFQNQINYPLLSQVEDGLSLNGSLVANIVYDDVGGGDIIINDIDGGPNGTRGGISHPFHLHGRSFYLVGRGLGNMTAGGLKEVALNTTNPLRRDTLHVDGGTWAVLRLVTDTPGVWPIHCHIGWHLAEGKLAAVVILPEVIKNFARPSAWSALCTGLNRSAFGPDRRGLPALAAVQARTAEYGE